MQGSDWKQLFADAALELRQPAGPDPRFSTREGLAQHRHDFIVATHATFKKWQTLVIEQLLILEAVIARDKTHPTPGKVATEWAEYSMAAMRQITDSLVWITSGLNRNRVKRVCLHRRPRPSLSESNYASVMTLVNRYNLDPTVFAQWNDATSCVDIGDVTVHRPLITREPLYIELKEGLHSKEISELVRNPDEKAAAEFAAQHGQKAKKQLERATRQALRGKQAMQLLNYDVGTDPVSGRAMEVVDIGDAGERWADTLSGILDDALNSGSRRIVPTNENCIWVCVGGDENESRIELRDALVECLQKEVDARVTGTVRSNDVGRVINWGESLFRPVTLPLPLLPISANAVGEMLYGRLMRKVLLYFDWHAFAKIIQEEGGVFSWCGKKEAGQRLAEPFATKSFKVFGEVPKVEFGNVTLYPSGANLDEALFDCLEPRSLVKNWRKVSSTAHKGRDNNAD